ncbi:MAG: ATP-binding protein [Verrucomicrobiota bacterium]
MKARDNPFSTDRVLRIRYRPQETTWETLLERLVALRFRAAVIGPHGTGKTTLLEALAQKLPALGFSPCYLRLNSASSRQDKRALFQRIKRLGPRDLLIFDGAEQLNGIEWLWVRWVVRHAGGLVISLHHAARLPTFCHCTTSAALLEEIVSDLAPVARADLDRLFEQERGNLRNVLRVLYDRYALLPDLSPADSTASPSAPTR